MNIKHACWLILSCIIVASLNFSFWFLPNRPVALEEPWLGGRFQSLSYSPYRGWKGPRRKVYPTESEMRSDLEVLRGFSPEIRTYAVKEGMEKLPLLAREIGLKLTLGAYIGLKKIRNDAEVAALIAQANAYPDVVKRVLVGNEVLLRRDLKPEQLIKYIRKVKQSVRQPVSYADVWEFWLKNPALADEVDFITIHILPYWEDDPVSVDRAMQHTLDVYQRVHEAFPGKPIFIGEIGWPSAGRSREGAVPGRVNAARFLSSFANLAERRGMEYNVFESFDEPWKIRYEGFVGAHWGFLNSELQCKFRLDAPVTENPAWPACFAVSTLLGVFALGWYRRRYAFSGFLAAFRFAVLGQTLATILVALAANQWPNLSYVPAIPGILAMAPLEVLMAVAVLAAARRLGNVQETAGYFETLADRFVPVRPSWAVSAPALCKSEGNPGPAAENKPAVEKPESAKGPWSARCGRWLLLFMTLLAEGKTLTLIFNGRYRDFPNLYFLVPAAGLPLASLLSLNFRSGLTGLKEVLYAFSFSGAFASRAPLPVRQSDVQSASGTVEWVLSALLVCSAAVLLVLEKPTNSEAVLWSFLLAALAVPYAANAALAASLSREKRRTSMHLADRHLALGDSVSRIQSGRETD